MSAPKVNPEIAICQAKRRYSDELGARASASVICERTSKDKLGVYFCRFCRGWHVTSLTTTRGWRVTPDELFVEKCK